MPVQICSDGDIIYEFKEGDAELNILARLLIIMKLDPKRRETILGNETINSLIKAIITYLDHKYTPEERKENWYLGEPSGWPSNLSQAQIDDVIADLLSVKYGLYLNERSKEDIKLLLEEVFYPHVLDKDKVDEIARFIMEESVRLVRDDATRES
jgi:hypothetical protein